MPSEQNALTLFNCPVCNRLLTDIIHMNTVSMKVCRHHNPYYIQMFDRSSLELLTPQQAATKHYKEKR